MGTKHPDTTNASTTTSTTDNTTTTSPELPPQGGELVELPPLEGSLGDTDPSLDWSHLVEIGNFQVVMMKVEPPEMVMVEPNHHQCNKEMEQGRDKGMRKIVMVMINITSPLRGLE